MNKPQELNRDFGAAFGELGYSEEQIELMNVATEFCRERSPIDKVRALLDDAVGFDRATWDEMAALGWLAIAIPEDFGGVGLSLAEAVPIAEQMGRNLMASPFAATSVAAQALLTGGTDAQKARWLPKIAEGTIASLALVEAQSGWDLSAITAGAKDSDTVLTLSGEKRFVAFADSAELLIVSVMYEGAKRLCLIETADLPHGSMRRETIVDETKRSFSLSLDGVSIAQDALMDAHVTEATLTQIELATALLQSAEMCGGTQGAIDYTLEYLRTRKQFGKVIGEYQALKHPMANAYVEYEKARSHLYAAAHSFGDQGAGEIAVRMAKAASDSAYSFAADRAIQFHGGFGFTHDCNAGLYRRNAIWCASQYGDAAWHRAKLAELLF